LEKLENRTQIARMVNLFYSSIRSHDVLAPLFSKIQDWELHQERMTAFWSFVLLDEEGYSGNPIEKHFNLGIEPQHFQLWLRVFNTVLNENFEGEMVEKAKKRAEGIASMLNYKLSKNDGKLIGKAN